MVRMLQICRAIIHNKRIIDEPYNEWQDVLVEKEVMDPVIELLSSKNDDIVREALALLVILFDGGNKKSQQHFIDLVKQHKSDHFFLYLSERIRDAIDAVVEVHSPLFCQALSPTFVIESSLIRPN